MDARSALVRRRILDIMEETRLMSQRRVSPERVRRLTLFGCSRHPDAKQINKLQADQFTASVHLISLIQQQQVKVSVTAIALVKT